MSTIKQKQERLSVSENTKKDSEATLPLRPAKGSFPIVGVGASAGGLEAFVQFLAHLDAKTRMAFILVQHLYPNHESLLSEILEKSTIIPLVEVVDGIVVEPNHIYVMPANVGMTIRSQTQGDTQDFFLLSGTFRHGRASRRCL